MHKEPFVRAAFFMTIESLAKTVKTILKDFRLKDFTALVVRLQPLYLHRF